MAKKVAKVARKGRGVAKRNSNVDAIIRTGRVGLPFPGVTFESVLPLAKAIWDHAGASREIKRDTLFTEILNKAPESGHSRALIRNSGRYGLTVGNEKSETLRLSDKAVLLFDPSTAIPVRNQMKLDLAINSVHAFRLHPPRPR